MARVTSDFRIIIPRGFAMDCWRHRVNATSNKPKRRCQSLSLERKRELSFTCDKRNSQLNVRTFFVFVWSWRHLLGSPSKRCELRRLQTDSQSPFKCHRLSSFRSLLLMLVLAGKVEKSWIKQVSSFPPNLISKWRSIYKETVRLQMMWR